MRMLRIALLLVSILAVASAQQDQTLTINSGGLQRRVDVHLPSASPAKNLPVVLCYHGTGGTSTGISQGTGFNAFADQDGFIAVYPQAVTIGFDVQWNVFVDDQPGHAGVGDPAAPDDVQFTRDIIAELSSRWSVDTKRVFATGHSNGGFMCYALSMLASDAIAAIAPVSANLWADDKYLAQLLSGGTVNAMPLMHVHGTADGVVEYPDKDNVPNPYEEYPLFVFGAACSATTYSKVVPLMTNVDKLVFCEAPMEVSLIRITGMGHSWSNGVYPTTAEIVKFFGLRKTTGVPNVSENPIRFTLSPLPAQSTVSIDFPEAATVAVYSTLGTLVYSGQHAAGIETLGVSGLLPGVYFVRLSPGSGAATQVNRLVISR
jgi:poly(3-hydroxybutyrate) depolymerase